MTDAIIFDLDTCIAAADEVGHEFFAPVFAGIKAANQGSHSESEPSWRLPTCGACRLILLPENTRSLRR